MAQSEDDFLRHFNGVPGSYAQVDTQTSVPAMTQEGAMRTNCFTGDTEIATKRGLKKIQEVLPGDIEMYNALRKCQVLTHVRLGMSMPAFESTVGLPMPTEEQLLIQRIQKKLEKRDAE